MSAKSKPSKKKAPKAPVNKAPSWRQLYHQQLELTTRMSRELIQAANKIDVLEKKLVRQERGELRALRERDRAGAKLHHAYTAFDALHQAVNAGSLAAMAREVKTAYLLKVERVDKDHEQAQQEAAKRWAEEDMKALRGSDVAGMVPQSPVTNGPVTVQAKG